MGLCKVALVSGVMLSSSAGQVMANSVPVQLNPTIALGGKLATAPSLIGEWKGSANSKGDDVVTVLELSVPAGGGAASWRHIGSKQVNGKWQDAVLKQGDLTRTLQGNQVKLTLHGFYGKSLQLEGSFQNGGKKITGHQVGNENYVFRFEK